MVETRVKVRGMMCGMCEAHIADVIRKQFPQARGVKASRKKNLATFRTDRAVDGSLLKKAIEETGYYYDGYETARVEEKKGLLGRLLG
jgi:copper chaperone